MQPKILLLDIETYPNTVHAWGLFDQNISINQIVTPGYTLCYSAKWYKDKEVFFDSIQLSSSKDMIKRIHALMEEADAICTYNGSKFDVPTLNKDFLLHKLTPPSPSKQIDLLKVVKNNFRFPSNKLDFVSQELGIGKKVSHAGHSLWVDCGKGDEKAWSQMRRYNIQDTLLLEKLYDRLKPWVKGVFNHSLYSNAGGCACPACGSTKSEKRGFYYTVTSKFQRLRCKECKHWFKDNTVLNRKDYKTSSI
jgi:DNA polymerase elongation subunit (family B)